MIRLTRRLQTLLCLSLLLCLAGNGCRPPGAKPKEESKEENPKKKGEAVPVEVSPLETGQIEAVIQSSNYLEAEDTVKVMARTSNFVKELLVEEGDKVEKDQVVIRLVDTEQQLTLLKAKSQTEKAREDFRRQEGLFTQELISEKEYSEARYNLEQLEIAAKEAQRQVDYTVVKAPISGTVTSRLVNIGDQVNNNQHLLDLVDFDSIVVRVYIPEKHIPRLSVGQKARVFSSAIPGRRFEARIIRIAPVVEAKTGTIKVTLGFTDPGSLRPGMYVDAELITQVLEDVVLIPKVALVYDNDRTYVFRLKEDLTVEKVEVVSVIEDREHVHPKEGFAKGEQIVTTGQNGLKDGSSVRLPGAPEEPEEKDAEKKEAD